MTHLGLFEGIGGFSLAVKWLGGKTLAWCEWNEFGQKVLKYHFPEAEGYGDITQTDFQKYEGKIDLLTGGFPCQPFSMAGKRKGTEDQRYLWHEMLRAIQEIKPKFVIAENVYGIRILTAEWYSSKCALIWRMKGTKFNRLLFQLAPKTHRTDEIGFGLLPTPTASAIGENASNHQIHVSKNGVAKPIRESGIKGNSNLYATVQVRGMLLTPSASDGMRSGMTMQNLKNHNKKNAEKSNLAEQIAHQVGGGTSHLNPRFVAEMMGFPPNWTELPFQSGEGSQ